MKKEILSGVQRSIVIAAGVILFMSIFVPIWRIELDAPQYPEGLKLQIHADKIGGDVDIINGLNHYIGMATLHTENFIEFSILPYLLPFFALLFIIAGVLARPKGLVFALVLFIIFGIVSMVDFYRWNYNYGHNLDPNAAIKVPGMAYQPPLIGYKQLLNFGAYSVPDIGGWLIIVSGLLLLVALGLYKGWFSKIINFKNTKPAFLLLFPLLINQCKPTSPDPITLHKDVCHFCKMTISDPRFGAEVITAKGRIQKYDDVACILAEMKENEAWSADSYWIADYLNENQLFNVNDAFFITNDNFKSPMRGNTAAFRSQAEAQKYADEMNSNMKKWAELVNSDL